MLAIPLTKNPKFELGQVVATPAVLDFMAQFGISSLDLLTRHQSGDWGDVGKEDAAENELGLREGFRLFSVYKYEHGTVWIITEWDRSATTLLLPSDY